ncbi:hypothetical protein SRABI133_00934 [Peribacillus simplex]|uniref:Uncharacterized protein n=1 Tax=Peribacillus simplex TaxID=1478 RepID=A0A9W4KQF3_9BACI|nr:hypothetical protein SRABI133_00934 [Peribacillus simplex]
MGNGNRFRLSGFANRGQQDRYESSRSNLAGFALGAAYILTLFKLYKFLGPKVL